MQSESSVKFLYNQNSYLREMRDLVMGSCLCPGYLESLDQPVSFNDDYLRCIFKLKIEEGLLYTFDKSSKIQVLISKEQIFNKFYGKVNFHKEIDFHNYSVTLEHPKFDIKVAYDQEDDIYAFCCVLLCDDYEKHNREKKVFGSPLLYNNLKQLLFLDEENDVKESRDFLKEIDVLSTLNTKLTKTNYLGYGSMENFFKENDYLLLSDTNLSKTLFFNNHSPLTFNRFYELWSKSPSASFSQEVKYVKEDAVKIKSPVNDKQSNSKLKEEGIGMDSGRSQFSPDDFNNNTNKFFAQSYERKSFVGYDVGNTAKTFTSYLKSEVKSDHQNVKVDGEVLKPHKFDINQKVFNDEYDQEELNQEEFNQREVVKQNQQEERSPRKLSNIQQNTGLKPNRISISPKKNSPMRINLNKEDFVFTNKNSAEKFLLHRPFLKKSGKLP